MWGLQGHNFWGLWEAQPHPKEETHSSSGETYSVIATTNVFIQNKKIKAAMMYMYAGIPVQPKTLPDL
jgi:hypothetical protein